MAHPPPGANDGTLESGPELEGLYKPLATNTIRLVRLRPGPNEDGISCEIQHWPLNECPPYYAVSYVWGDVSESASILVNGAELHIGIGLYRALVQFRQSLCDANFNSAPVFMHNSLETFWFWADSICLNQEDVKEKESQIPRMGAIFGRAECVLAWLGENKEGEENGLQLLMDLCRIPPPAVEDPWWDEEYRKSLFAVIQDDMEGFVRILFTLLVRPFFSRIWIIQEMAVGNGEPVLLAGKHWFTLSSLRRMWVCYLTFEVQHNFVFTSDHYHIEAFHRFRKLHQTDNGLSHDKSEAATLGWRLNRYLRPVGEAFRASRAHDQLYGLLGIAGAQNLPDSLRPDYGRPFGEVFRDYTRVCLEYCGDLSLLDRLNCHVSGVPSWVPDYRMHSWTRTHDDWPGAEFLPGDKLLAHGVVLETCVHSWTPREFEGEEDVHLRLTTTIESLRSFLGKVFDQSGESLATAFRTYIRLTYAIQGMFEGSEKDQERLSQLVTAGELADPDFLEHVSSGFALNYPVVVTEKAALHHVARRDVKPRAGDVICALQGSCLPVLLRQCSEDEYTFLGMVQIWDTTDALRLDASFFEGKELQNFKLI